MTMKKPLLCPTCRKAVEATNEDFPFCSDRCRLIDLGKWASGDYKISSPIFDEELLQDLQMQQEGALNADPNNPEKNWKN